MAGCAWQHLVLSPDYFLPAVKVVRAAVTYIIPPSFLLPSESLPPSRLLLSSLKAEQRKEEGKQTAVSVQPSGRVSTPLLT